MQGDHNLFTKNYEGADGLDAQLEKFLTADDNLRLLLKRGETENLSEHW